MSIVDNEKFHLAVITQSSKQFGRDKEVPGSLLAILLIHTWGQAKFVQLDRQQELRREVQVRY